MRRILTTAALWALIAVAAVAGGAVAVVVTGAGTAATPVLSPRQVREALADVPAEPDPPEASPVPDFVGESQIITTEAGTVGVTCAGDVIAAEVVTPAAGWRIGEPTGGEHKRETRFTADGASAVGGTLVVTYVCESGKAVWGSRTE